MRIAHISDCYAPRLGGIENQVQDLAAHQAAAGHEVHVLTGTPGVAPDGSKISSGAIEMDGAVTVHRHATKIPIGLPIHPREAAMIRATLKEIRPDVVHIHAGIACPFAFDGLRVAVALSIPTAVSWHCMLDGWVGMFRAMAPLMGWRDMPVAWTAVSEAAAQRVRAVLRDRRGDSPRVDVVHDGVELDRWAEAARQATPDDEAGPLRVVATQRLAGRKRSLPMLRAVKRARGALGGEADIAFSLIGTGGQAAAIARWARRNRAGDWLTLHGRLTREELVDKYCHSDVFVSAAKLEAFGIAALEARATGMAVVALRGTGIEDFVTHGETGLIVDDDAGLSAALATLARDRDLLRKLRATSLANVPTTGWRNILAAFDEQYARARALREGRDVTSAAGTLGPDMAH